MAFGRVLDLFSGAGGAGAGYARLGLEVVGGDLHEQPHYPYTFVQGDWYDVLRQVTAEWERDGLPYMIHASPPCQAYSTMTKRWGRSSQHPDLVGPVRDALRATGAPYVIENVVGAPLHEPILACGSMFGLGDTHGRQLRRHRLFEASVPLVQDRRCAHTGQAIGVYGHPGGTSKRDGIVFAQFRDWQDAMGIDWMTVKEIAEAIPPAYTEWVGGQLLAGVARPTLWS